LTWAIRTGLRFKPVTALHDYRGDAQAHMPLDFLWQIYKRTRRHFQFLKLRIEIRQDLVRKTSADSAGEHEPVRTLVADQQGTKVFSASFGEHVAPDNELLGHGNFDLNPCPAAPTGFVDRIQSFGN